MEKEVVELRCSLYCCLSCGGGAQRGLGFRMRKTSAGQNPPGIPRAFFTVLAKPLKRDLSIPPLPPPPGRKS